MDFFRLFNSINKSNSYLIVPNDTKNLIIQKKTLLEIENKSIYLFKIITVNELIELFSFTFSNELYLNNYENHNVLLSITKELIKFSRYNLDNKNIDLNLFISNNESLITKYPHFINSIKTLEFNIIGSSILLDPFFNFYNINLNKINIDNKGISSNLLKFNKKEDEVFYIFEAISKLLDNNTNINNIFIANSNSNDYTVLDKFSNYYKIPIIHNINTKLINIPYIKDIMNNSFEDIIKLLSNLDILSSIYTTEYNINKEEFTNNINSLITIINKYPYTKYNSNIVYEIILDDVKNTNVSTNSKVDGIRLISLDEIYGLDSSKDIVFIINAAYEHFPILTKDRDYLSDDEKIVIKYPTSYEINTNSNLVLEEIIKLNQVKHISYCLKDLKNEYAASDIFSKYVSKDLKTYKFSIDSINKGYAINYYKSYFNNSTKGSLLTTFNPSFKLDSDNKEKLNKYIEDKNLLISPTDITKYIQLPFVFYLEKILGLSTFTNSVNLMLGNFFHSLVEVTLLLFFEMKVDRSKDSDSNKFHKDEKVHQEIFDMIIELSSIDINSFDYNVLFNRYYDIYFKNEKDSLNNMNINSLTNEDKLLIRTLFYIKKHQDTIIKAIQLLIDLESTIESEELIIEKSIEYNNLRGKADLIKLYDNNTFSIIDYKTGSKEAFNIEKIENLLDSLLLSDSEEIAFGSLDLLQLVLYSYILTKSLNEYKLKDLAYYSYFTDQLNGITMDEFNKEFYAFTSKRKIDSYESLEEIYLKIETLVNNITNNINDSNFNTNIRLDEKSKQGLDKSHYSIYEALIFFSEEGGLDLDEED